MSNPQLKFASFDEAIDHLSNITGKRVKIAWRDESSEIMNKIINEIRGTPGLVKKFNKYIKDALEPGMKVRSSNAGKLYVVDEVEEEMMDKLTNSISNAPKKEIFDMVQKDKKSFPKFHETYKKGLQEQDGFYRAKPGLLQKGKDFLKGEKGEQSEAEEVKSKEAEDDLKDVIDMAKKRIVKDKIKDTDVRDVFVKFISKPENKKSRERFIKEFSDSIDNDEISVEEAQKYEKVLKTFMSRIEKDLIKEMPKFVEAMKKLTSKIEKEVDDVEVEVVKGEGSENESKPVGIASIDEQVIDNVIDIWADSSIIKGE